MKNSKRQIDIITRINILYGSNLAKLLVLLATLLVAILTNRYPVYTVNSLFYIILSILAYGILFANYFKKIDILQNGVLARGKFYHEDITKYYYPGFSGRIHFCKYFFRFKDGEEQHEFFKWTTNNNYYERTKKTDILYSLKEPGNALVIGMLQGGPYSIADDRVSSGLRFSNVVNALLTTAGIIFIFFYLSQ